MLEKELKYWIALNNYPKFGPVMFGRLRNYFDSLEEAFKAPIEDLRNAGINTARAEGFIHLRDEISPDALIAQVRKANVHVITIEDELYPKLLKTIYDPPALLYVAGELPPDGVAHVAIVGSRAATNYGKRVAKEMAGKLASSGVVVVSGLAFGIDEEAQSATVDGHGVTVAVLGCGLARLNSRQRYLSDKIIAGGGAVVSEFPMNIAGLSHHYPIRNRIIAGLSHGTLVVEAAIKSGSLITARAALEQGRDVFAIPGSIYSSTSEGTNQLIKEGAHPITAAENILEFLNVEHVEAQVLPQPEPDSKEEATLLALLSKNPVHIDELNRQTDLPTHAVASTLALLEMKGRTRQIGGMYYILV